MVSFYTIFVGRVTFFFSQIQKPSSSSSFLVDANGVAFFFLVDANAVNVKIKFAELTSIHHPKTTVNSFLAETPESTEAMVNAKEAGEFAAVNVPSDVLQSQSSFLAISHLKNNWPMKIKIESGTNVCHLLLLIAALVSTITYRTALKIRACKLEQGYNYSSSLISICQIVDQHPLFIQLVMAFNSIAFFLSMALLMILFNELPLRPLLLVSAFSMLGAYICAITDLTKPT
ncbi:hypothetical protein CISIN_1g025689mg [Citrus sinensis]|uniref:PGG domain-containing protein n=1 Tax=Citrus sinensis TaxID=2711 RepID=A0A067DR01_CITSI|nr:hypothetical protein CISIN_1g025689mg [Citrus sinensis]